MTRLTQSLALFRLGGPQGDSEAAPGGSYCLSQPHL